MPFYSRHSNDGSNRFLGDVHDENDYIHFMNRLFNTSSFGVDIQRHYDSSDADVIPTTSESEESEDSKEKEKQYQKEYHKKYFQEKQNKPYICNICGKSLSNSSNIKRHEKSRKCQSAKNEI